jgi:hypothetical protein
VVVIVGVIIVAIAASAVRGRWQPATSAEPSPRGSWDPAPFPEPGAEPDTEPDTEPDLERARGGLVHRLRAAGLLAVAVVVLGAGAAALLGVAVLVGARAIDGALG